MPRQRKTYSPPKRVWIVVDTLSGNASFIMLQPPVQSDMYENEEVYEYDLKRKAKILPEPLGPNLS
jgi:hypothetical protein